MTETEKDDHLPSKETPQHLSATPANTIIHDILKTPEKKTPVRKRKLLTSLHLTSPENIEETRAKKSSSIGTKGGKNKKKTEVNRRVTQLGPTPAPTKEDECGFCLLNYYSEKSLSKGDWIRCQLCNVWYHELCVGAKGKKQFVCGKCQ